MLIALVIFVALLLFLVVFGVLGFFGIAAAAFVLAFIWYIAPIILMLVVGTIALMIEPVLKRISPHTWAMVQENLRLEAARKVDGRL